MIAIADSLIALIPVKALAQAKTRLQAYLDGAQRVQLMHDTLRHTIRALQASGVVTRVVLVSQDPQVARWARDWQVEIVSEQVQTVGLNAALEEARQAICDSTQALLIVPGDMAWLEAEDVREMAQQAADIAGPVVLIAPDRHERGTNALLLRPPCVIDFAFGLDSAQQHAARAQLAGAALVWYRSSSLSLDVDELSDLHLYEAAPFWLDTD